VSQDPRRGATRRTFPRRDRRVNADRSGEDDLGKIQHLAGACYKTERRDERGLAMELVQVRMHIEAPPERVFDAVSDHERFLRTEDGVRTRILRPGTPERDGLGCLREVRVGRRARYVEEVTAWQRPVAFEYTIRESSLPLRHAGSRLTFTPHGPGTEVEWTSRFAVTVPLVGGLLGARARRLYAASFTALLRQAKARLEGA